MIGSRCIVEFPFHSIGNYIMNYISVLINRWHNLQRNQEKCCCLHNNSPFTSWFWCVHAPCTEPILMNWCDNICPWHKNQLTLPWLKITKHYMFITIIEDICRYYKLITQNLHWLDPIMKLSVRSLSHLMKSMNWPNSIEVTFMPSCSTLQKYNKLQVKCYQTKLIIKEPRRKNLLVN